MARAFFLSQKDAAKAKILAEQSITIFRQLATAGSWQSLLNLLGQILSAEHEYDRAESLLEESITTFKTPESISA